jgi:ATP-binding cassette subfamily B protein
VLDAGSVAELGTHDELLARGGRYAALVARDADVVTGDLGAVTAGADGSPSMRSGDPLPFT